MLSEVEALKIFKKMAKKKTKKGRKR